MTVPAGKVRRAGRYAGEWSLFADWSQATGRVPLPATQATVLAFLDEEAPTGGTATRWLTGITAAHAAAGHPTPCRGVVAAWAAAARAGTPTTDPITPQSLWGAFRAIDRGTWSRRPAPLPPARHDNHAHGQPPAKTTRRPEPVPAASNPGWHRDGVAARVRDHALLADVDAALDALDQAAEEMQKRMRQVLGTRAR